MVIIGNEIQSKLLTLINQYGDYRTKHEYGISAFWYWYYQVMNYLNNMDNLSISVGFNRKYRMPRWGTVIYTKIVINGDVIIFANDFLYSKRNLYIWLKHQTNRNPSYSVCDTCFGYSSVLYDNSQKYGILNPDGKRLVKPVFDDIINFHHSTEDYSIIHAIGFIGDRVYSISTNGDVTLLHMSKDDYLKMKHRYDEMIRRKIRIMLNESKKHRLNRVIGRTVRRVLREHLTRNS